MYNKLYVLTYLRDPTDVDAKMGLQVTDTIVWTSMNV